MQVSGRTVRFTNFTDEKSLAFEAEAGELLTGAALEQRISYFNHCGRERYLMQMRTVDGRPAFQVCAYVGRPKSGPLSGFALLSTPDLHIGLDAKEEEIGIEALRKLAAEIPGAMSLRLQPKRFDPAALESFRERAIALGFKPSDPVGPTRTLLLDILGTPAAQYDAFSKSTKSKIRHHGRQTVDIRPLDDPKYIPALRAASDASRKRTHGGATSYDYDTLFALAKSDPSAVRILGLFAHARPDDLMAYVIAFRNGTVCEFSSAGSFRDADLRKMPFNYFLVWELIEWARSVGCKRFDMGGVTPGDATDPLAGISRFKRSITAHEVETGGEMVFILNPIQYRLYRFLKTVREWISAPSLVDSRI